MRSTLRSILGDLWVRHGQSLDQLDRALSIVCSSRIFTLDPMRSAIVPRDEGRLLTAQDLLTKAIESALLKGIESQLSVQPNTIEIERLLRSAYDLAHGAGRFAVDGRYYRAEERMRQAIAEALKARGIAEALLDGVKEASRLFGTEIERLRDLPTRIDSGRCAVDVTAITVPVRTALSLAVGGATHRTREGATDLLEKTRQTLRDLDDGLDAIYRKQESDRYVLSAVGVSGFDSGIGPFANSGFEGSAGLGIQYEIKLHDPPRPVRSEVTVSRGGVSSLRRLRHEPATREAPRRLAIAAGAAVDSDGDGTFLGGLSYRFQEYFRITSGVAIGGGNSGDGDGIGVFFGFGVGLAPLFD